MSTRKIGLIACGLFVGFFAVRKRWNILHNGLVHPLYIFAESSERLDRLHDWTGKKWEGRDGKS